MHYCECKIFVSIVIGFASIIATIKLPTADPAMPMTAYQQ